MIIRILLALLVALPLFSSGCSCSGGYVLAPSEVDESLLDTVVRVRGEVTYAVENPMGQGGMYLKLGDGEGEVDVRVPDEIWRTYDDKEKSIFSEGKTLTAEGILFRAGSVLVVIHEKYEYTSGRTSK